MREKIKTGLVAYFIKRGQDQDAYISFSFPADKFDFDGEIDLELMASMIEETIK